MRARVLLAGIVVIAVSGCSSGNGVVELPVEGYGSYYTDLVEYSDVRDRGYGGFFLASGVSLLESLSFDDLDAVTSGWEWSLEGAEGDNIAVDSSYAGLDDAYSESSSAAEGDDSLESNGVVEGEDSLESAGTVGEDASLENGIAGDSLGVSISGSFSGADSSVAGTSGGAAGSFSESLGGSGSASSLSEVASLGLELVPGQSVVVTPGYGNTLEAYVSSIEIANYSTLETVSVSECVGFGWYTLSIRDYLGAFGLDPDDSFSDLATLFGNPSVAWEEHIGDAEYVEGIRREYIAFEFPMYTFEFYVVEDGLGGLDVESTRYIPRGLWLPNDLYVGMRLFRDSECIEIVHDELPEIELSTEMEVGSGEE